MPALSTSLSQAFEPESNIAYAASFLRSLYQDDGSWKQAAGDYHSKTPHLGKEYVGLVYDSWFKIVDKLRSARLSVPPSSLNGLREMQQADDTKPVILNSPTATAPAPKRINVAVKANDDISAYRTPGTKFIRVSASGAITRKEVKKNENGVIVIHPEINIMNSASLPDRNRPPEPMVIADATPLTPKKSLLDVIPASAPAPAVPPQAKIIRLDNRLVDHRPVNSDIKKGPNFIFND